MQDPFRFQRAYGVPSGRSTIATKSFDHLYQVEKVLDVGGDHANAIGGLNNGVFLVRHTKSGKRCVKKCIPTEQGGGVILEREILLLQVLKHPNVVRFVDACITETIPRQMTLYVEYYNVGGLDKMMKRYMDHRKNHDKPRHCRGCLGVPEAFVWHVLHSLASALQYLHHGIEKDDRRDPPRQKGPAKWPPILHCDIKPDNILMRTAPDALSLYKDASQPLLYPHKPFNIDDPEGSCKVYPQVVLADFGMATQYHEPDFYNLDGFNGIPQFCPPEPNFYTSGRGDVWAVGASVLSLCRLLPDGPMGNPPPHHPNPQRWYKDPEKQRLLARIGPGKGYSTELKDILAQCLMFHYEERVKSWQLMKRVWVIEKLLFSSPGEKLKVRLLPEWVYGDKSKA